MGSTWDVPISDIISGAPELGDDRADDVDDTSSVASSDTDRHTAPTINTDMDMDEDHDFKQNVHDEVRDLEIPQGNEPTTGLDHESENDRSIDDSPMFEPQNPQNPQNPFVDEEEDHAQLDEIEDPVAAESSANGEEIEDGEDGDDQLEDGEDSDQADTDGEDHLEE